MSARIPKAIGSFEVSAELGEGGMGLLYRALQPDLEREVVLKRMHRDLARDPSAAERFVREARSAAQVHHQNVVTVYDCFEWRGDRFIAQEFVEGGDLAHAIVSAAPIPPRIAALIGLQVLNGLEAIHGRGVIHRDLKPANVLLSRLGEVKVGDFGIALDAKGGPALTAVGHAVGTPTYMSPEQLRGERADPRSDLFSWGVIVYEMLCGHVPYDAAVSEEEGSLLQRIEDGVYTPLRRAAPGCPRSVARLVARCLQAKPRRRPASACEARAVLERWLGSLSPADVERDIAEWLASHPVFVGHPDHTELVAIPTSRPPRRRGLWAAGLAMVALAVLGLGWVAMEATHVPWSVLRQGPAWFGAELAPRVETGESAELPAEPDAS